MIDALLIYPKLGRMDSMIKDLPLSIIYAAAESVKRGYDIALEDFRCMHDRPWEDVLEKYLEKGVRMVGVSAMTGTPLDNAREISTYVKKHYPDVMVVWGGPHGTVLPSTIEEPFIDMLVRGYGSNTTAEIIAKLRAGETDYETISGISFVRDNGEIVHTDRSTSHEMIYHKDLPYDLIDVNSSEYQRSYMNQRMFPIFTAIGCPYQCAFCVHPTVYRVINGKKWLPYPDEEVIAHMEYVIEKYDVTHICVIDDTSFVDIARMERLFKLILERGIDVILEFRGARINEIDKMSDEFIELMVRAGTRVIMVGVESAGDRILKIMQKGITREQILRVNEKLAKHPKLTAHYNLIYGVPGEEYDDLRQTKDAVLEMLRVNPWAYFGFGGDWKPIPGSKMLDMAKDQYGLQEPVTLDEWIAMDSMNFKNKIRHPWYTNRHNNLIKLMQMASFVVDDKLIKETKGNKSMWFRTIRTLSRIYKPIALFRLKHDLHHFMVEYFIWEKLMAYLTSRNLNKHQDA